MTSLTRRSGGRTCPNFPFKVFVISRSSFFVGSSTNVRNNVVENCRYASGADADWETWGILVFESDDVHPMGNSVTNNDASIAASSWGYFLETADGNRIMKNTVTDAFVGINAIEP